MKPLISVVTSSRADFGLLRNLLQKIQESESLDLELVVTGTHLSGVFGYSVDEIKSSGFFDFIKIEMNLDLKSPIDMSHAVGDLMGRITQHYSQRTPSLCLVVGDRYEILGIAIACAIKGVPLGHIHGGELTFGSKDDMFRHAITKLASLHFVANPEFSKRIKQLGENPDRIFEVGGLGVDSIASTRILSNLELESNLGFSLNQKLGLVTFHPDSVEPELTYQQLEILISSISKFPEIQFIFTGANADYLGPQINSILKESADQFYNLHFVESLGQQNYYSLLTRACFVLGNSSSGILEAPTFSIPTVNIGTRQNGRPRASSVIDVEFEENSIVEAINKSISKDFLDSIGQVINPYGQPGACEKILKVLENLDYEVLLPKIFHDLLLG